ncbi:MAG: metallophosphoesterase [Kofleriaceae bacterium]
MEPPPAPGRPRRADLGRALAAGMLALACACTTDPAPLGRPGPLPEGAFSLVVLPDTQNYPRDMAWLLDAQIEWILARQAEQRIAMVLHVGDIVEANDEFEWFTAESILRKLDGRVPYALAVGNHDLGRGGSASDRSTRMVNHFSPARLVDDPSFGGAFEPDRLDNAYYLFSAGGADYLVVTLEFGPRDEALAWASEVTARHPDRKVIVLTHCYTYADGSRVGPGDDFHPRSYGMAEDRTNTVNDGDDIWRRYVRHHPNIVMVISGHITHGGAARQTAVGDHGNLVHEVLANYQEYERGGGGWLRLVRIDPAAATITMWTMSPIADRLWDAPAHTFELPLP